MASPSQAPAPRHAAVEETDVAHPSIGTLVREATGQFSTLVRSEIELAKLEVKGEVKKVATGSALMVAAGVIALLAVPFIFVALAEGFVEWFGWWRWASYATIWVAFLLVAGVLGLLGFRRFKKLQAPAKTIDSVKQNAQIADAFKKSEKPA